MHEIDSTNAIEFMNKKYIVHRDIKTENILIKDENRFVLADFGVSDQASDLDGCSKFQGKIGTPAFMTPEVSTNKYYDLKVDIWSLGLVIYRIVMRQFPFGKSDNEHEEFLIDFTDPCWTQGSLPRCKDLISKMLVINPSERFSVSQCLSHNFTSFSNDSWSNLITTSTELFNEQIQDFLINDTKQFQESVMEPKKLMNKN